jgi:hypothetical protein
MWTTQNQFWECLKNRIFISATPSGTLGLGGLKWGQSFQPLTIFYLEVIPLLYLVTLKIGFRVFNMSQPSRNLLHTR